MTPITDTFEPALAYDDPRHLAAAHFLVEEAALLDNAASGRLAALTGDTVEALNRLRRLTPKCTSVALEWGAWEPLAAERLLLAELLLGRGEWTEAERVAASLDHPWPVMHLPYVRGSLAVRVRAAEALGQPGRAARYRERLETLAQARRGAERRT